MKRAACILIAATQLLAVIAAWLWTHTHHALGNLLTGDPAGQALAWGRLAGLLAALGILFQIALIGRGRQLGHAFGLDRLTRLHHAFGFALALLLLLHPVLVTLGHAAQAEVGYAEQTRDFWANWKGLAGALSGLALMLAALLTSALVLLRRMRYELWHATHVALYGALALAFLHQVATGSDFASHPLFKGYWLLLNAAVLLNLLACRFARPLALYFRHRFAVEKLAAEAADVTSVYIRGRDLSSLGAEAGQFVIVRFWAKGFRWEAHPFSLSKPPGAAALRLSIKHVGDFTRRIPKLAPGTPVLIDGPHGIFTSRHCASDRALLIAGGIGITPLRALAEELVNAGRDVTLLYGSRSAAGIVFREELDALAAASGGRLRLTHVLSADPQGAGERGVIDRDRLSRLAPDLRDRDVFVCGPPAMMKGVLRALSDLGVRRSSIHHERFAL
jgi:predicted ferric reductase